MKEKIIGILGGMGPDATVDLFNKIIKNTPINKEQDHCRIIVDNNPKIESRTDALLSGRTGRVSAQLEETAVNLQRAGADFIVIPCNTAHYFIEDMQKNVKIKIINMIEETARYVKSNFPGIKKAGLMGTTATARLKIYDRMLEKEGIETVSPRGREQENIMNAIIAIKEKGSREKAKAALLRGAETLYSEGAELIIAGCTEIPLVLGSEDLRVPFVDPSEILALRAILTAKGGSFPQFGMHS